MGEEVTARDLSLNWSRSHEGETHHRPAFKLYWLPSPKVNKILSPQTQVPGGWEGNLP